MKKTINKIMNINANDYDLEDHVNNNYGKNLFIGEYAMSDYEDFDILTEDFKLLNLEICQDFGAETYSSKSGTGFWLIASVDTDEFVYRIENEQDKLNQNPTSKDVRLAKKEIKLIIKEYKEKINILEKEKQIATKWIESIALGKRSTVFSNGEVVFNPLKTTTWTEKFTPYYNPNNE